jgi:WD40 repeat protein
VSAAWDRTLRLWDLESGACLATLQGHTGAVRAVAPAGPGRVVSASYDYTLRVWDLDSGACRATLKGHTDGVNAVAAADSGRAVSESDDGTLRLWDLATGHCLAIFPCEAPVESVAFAPGPPPTIIAGLADGQVQFFRLEEA